MSRRASLAASFAAPFFAAVSLSVCMAATAARAADDASPPPNVLLICIDDLRNQLGYLGADQARTPALDRLASTSVSFSNHYVQVPTCGASRAALMRGRYPDRPQHLNNDAILKTQREWASESLPAWFLRHGYRTYSLGKVTHYPGNLAGPDWDAPPEELPGAWTRSWIPDGPWPHAEAIMHGYAEGRPRVRGQSPPIESREGPDTLYPDAWVADAAIEHLQTLRDSDDPWFFAVGFFKPHLPFAAPQRWFDLHPLEAFEPPVNQRRPPWPSGWHRSGEFRNNYDSRGRDPADDPQYAREVRRAYAAAVSYMDHQLGRLIESFDELDPERETVLVLWSDHGFLIGEHAIWGKHCLYEEALRSPLIIRGPGVTQAGKISKATVETVDIYPTLVDLCGLPAPPIVSGRSLRPWLETPDRESAKPAVSFQPPKSLTVRTDRWRLIEHPPRGGEPTFELFDYENDPHELTNAAAEHPDVVAELRQLLRTRVPGVE